MGKKMAAVRIKLKSGDSEIEVEGSKAEVDQLLDLWWPRLGRDEDSSANLPPKNQATKRRPHATGKSAALQTSGKNGDSKFDPVALANSIKERKDFKSIQAHVLHKKDMYRKIALICLQADDHLTSGDIARVMKVLDLKGSVGNVSSNLKTNSSKFVTTGSRRAGGAIAGYKLTSHAKTEFEDWLANAGK